MTDPGKIALKLHHVGNNLEVQMGRPVAVRRKTSNMAKGFTGLYDFSLIQSHKRFRRKVPVQSTEPVLLNQVFQDYGWPVIPQPVIVSKAMHPSFQWSVNLLSGFHPHINPKMHVPNLLGLVQKQIAAFVEVPVLQVSAISVFPSMKLQKPRDKLVYLGGITKIQVGQTPVGGREVKKVRACGIQTGQKQGMEVSFLRKKRLIKSRRAQG